MVSWHQVEESFIEAAQALAAGAQVQILILPLASCVTFGILQNLSKPQFLHL